MEATIDMIEPTESEKWDDLIKTIEESPCEVSMGWWQSNGDAGIVELAAQDLTSLHTCGNSACIAGYLAVSPLFQSFGGGSSSFGAPVMNWWCSGRYTFARWMEMPTQFAASLVLGVDQYDFIKGWNEWGKEEALQALEIARNWRDYTLEEFRTALSEVIQ